MQQYIKFSLFLTIVFTCFHSRSVFSCEYSEKMSSIQDKHEHSEAKPVLVGGVGGLRPINDDDMKVWNKYKLHLEKQIRDAFKVPETFELKPVQVATQVVAGLNYSFRVELPGGKYAVARVYHIEWKPETHGLAEQVKVHPHLLSSVNEKVDDF